jgi:hypothetical protein
LQTQICLGNSFWQNGSICHFSSLFLYNREQHQTHTMAESALSSPLNKKNINKVGFSKQCSHDANLCVMDWPTWWQKCLTLLFTCMRTHKNSYSWSYYEGISIAWKVRCFKQKSHSTQVFPEKLNQNSATLFLPQLLLFNRSVAFLWHNI